MSDGVQRVDVDATRAKSRRWQVTEYRDLPIVSLPDVTALRAALAASEQRAVALARLLSSRVMHLRPGLGTGAQGMWYCDLCTGRALESEPFVHAAGCPLGDAAPTTREEQPAPANHEE